MNVQALVNADLTIQNLVARQSGSAHDATILNNSRLRTRFESNEFNDFVLVGDSGYPISRNILTPLGNPRTKPEDLYNESQNRIHNPVERAFGVWKRRFPIAVHMDQLKV